MSAAISSLKLRSGRDFPVRRGHPWIFSGALAPGKTPNEGELVRVLSDRGECLGIGYYSGKRSIAVKMLSREDRSIDTHFWLEKIRSAFDWRLRMGLGTSSETNAYRLVNAEGDSVPGLIVDLYGRTAVIQCQSSALVPMLDDICEALRGVLSERLDGIFLREYDRESDAVPQSRYLWGRPGESVIVENGCRFWVDWERGQKTGFFLDQRENRKFLRDVSSGKTVLNAFCYTGGFTINALRGGAKSVTSVDSSGPALETLQKNIDENFPQAEHHEICEDFLRYMQNLPEQFDLIVLDPPAFAKDKRSVPNGLKGYRSINEAALRALPSGGGLFTFSWSQLVGRAEFREAVNEAAYAAGKRVRVLRHLSQSPCHPVSISHPEGEYLKGLVLGVE